MLDSARPTAKSFNKCANRDRRERCVDYSVLRGQWPATAKVRQTELWERESMGVNDFYV